MSKKNYPQEFRAEHSPTLFTLEAPIRYSIVRAGAFEPERKNPADAGIDFFIPLHSWATKSIELLPGARILIPSGVRMEVPAGWALVFLEKSGIATKFGIVLGARVVDHNYRGEIGNSDIPILPDGLPHLADLIGCLVVQDISLIGIIDGYIRDMAFFLVEDAH